MSPWPTIDPGRMIHRITIVRQVNTTDVSGAKVDYETHVICWAEKFEGIVGLEQYRSGQYTSQKFPGFRIHYVPGVLDNMRVRMQSGEEYAIRYIENPRNQNIVLELNCIALPSGS
jgi:SPP1 family predicted phage head-tail adaptor